MERVVLIEIQPKKVGGKEKEPTRGGKSPGALYYCSSTWGGRRETNLYVI